ncbi:MAG: biosynthetic-type acetolactate synthase large subunit [Chloroflexi bacterium]|nr:biosynthetic-type acetolactate synthase large subunit [Chloroflexota bacterium]
MKLSGSHILCESLLREGVEVMFGLPGGAILPFYDALLQYPQLRHILVRHEQGASFAADGYARATGKVGVCVATSGPGATNLVTGIAGAQMDSVPVVAITGQVPTAMIGRDAFQETDITGVTLPVTKHNYLITRAEDIAETVKEAFHLARTGRPGPVLIDLPKDVQTTEAIFRYPDKVELLGYKPTVNGHPAQIKKAARAIAEAKRPLLISGHGTVIANAHAELKELVEKAQIPVLTTLLGIGSFPETHVLSYGLVGMHGMTWANYALGKCDLLIGIGMRFDDRVTGKLSTFAPQAQIIHIDIDPAELGKNVKVHIPIVGNVRNVLAALNKDAQQATHREWIHELEEYKYEHPSLFVPPSPHLMPQTVIQKLYEVTRGDSIVVADVGQHQMWAAQHFFYDKPNSFLTSGGHGAMGYALPAAMGAKVGRPEENVWCVMGDGGFQMTMMELATMVQDRVNVKIALLNNGYLGMVRQFQDLMFGHRYSASALTGPDFVKIAEAYGIYGRRVDTAEDTAPAIEEAMAYDGPALIEFAVEQEENVYPMVLPGGSVTEVVEDPRLARMREGARR